MMQDDQLETLIGSWRSRHGTIAFRSRGTKMVETVHVSFEDGRAAELTREAGAKAWTVLKSPDDAPPPVDWASLPPAVRQAAEPVRVVKRPTPPTTQEG